MRLVALHVALTVLVTFGNCIPATTSNCILQVDTNSGVLNGFINSRWEPPSKLESTASLNATNIGPAYPQALNSQATGTPNVYSPYGGNQTGFSPLQTFSEDCLTLNVSTPQNPKKKMPVFVWYFGGGFLQGGTSSLYFNPQSWVQRTQGHIVVTVNFRSNIFGFPNAANLTDQNLGLLDQRLALEWVRDNIANFGGDPSKIVAWGQSARAIAYDYLNFAYPEDPIVNGMILDSNTTFYPQERIMDIEDVVEKANLTSVFLPVADEHIVVSNYTQRYDIGALSSVPAIIGTNQHKFNALIPHIPGVPYNITLSDSYTNIFSLCTAATTSQLREVNGCTTYRDRYDGKFSKISSLNFPGAYHAAELPLIFGTAGNYHGESITYENVVNVKMQDLWLEFANDPQGGLRNVGWSPYGEGEAMIFGDTETPVRQIDISELDGVFTAQAVDI